MVGLKNKKDAQRHLNETNTHIILIVILKSYTQKHRSYLYNEKEANRIRYELCLELKRCD